VEVYGPQVRVNHTPHLHANPPRPDAAAGWRLSFDADMPLITVYAAAWASALKIWLSPQPHTGEMALEIVDSAGPLCRRFDIGPWSTRWRP